MFPDEPSPVEEKTEIEDNAQNKKEEEFKDEAYKRFPPPTKDHIEKFLQESDYLKVRRYLFIYRVFYSRLIDSSARLNYFEINLKHNHYKLDSQNVKQVYIVRDFRISH